MTDSTMVERVARAIAKLRDYREYDEVGGHPAWRVFEADARAAIEAMMEPTEAMISFANETVRPDSDNAQCPEFYDAMISEALRPTPSKEQ